MPVSFVAYHRAGLLTRRPSAYSALVSTVRGAIGTALPGVHVVSALERAALCGRHQQHVHAGRRNTAESRPSPICCDRIRMRTGIAGTTEQTNSIADRPIAGLHRAGIAIGGLKRGISGRLHQLEQLPCGEDVVQQRGHVREVAK
jgi:hypothetical protein